MLFLPPNQSPSSHLSANRNLKSSGYREGSTKTNNNQIIFLVLDSVCVFHWDTGWVKNLLKSESELYFERIRAQTSTKAAPSLRSIYFYGNSIASTFILLYLLYSFLLYKCDVKCRYVKLFIFNVHYNHCSPYSRSIKLILHHPTFILIGLDQWGYMINV